MPRQTHLPPGPSGLPIIGNLADIPSTEPWVYFYQQSRKYGSDINSYRLLNQTIIVLNSRESIDALFTTKVDQYSSKPPRKMSQLSDLTMTLPFMNPGDIFSHARKQFHLGIGPSTVHQYNAYYEQSSRQFIHSLSNDPNSKSLEKNIDDSLGRVFLNVSTGYAGQKTPATLNEMNALAHFAADVLGDNYKIFDIVPFISSLPTWVPHVGPLLKLAAQWKQRLHALAQSTVQLTNDGKKAGSASVMSSLLATQPEPDDQTKMIAVTMNAGGMLATESATLTFLLAMARFPEIQKRAQAEVDALGGRLPALTDRPNLPYVDAILSEVLRWVSIAPVIAREVIKDDHYNNYLIPKGATIMANNWAISRDASVYPEPEVFRPERFLDESGPAPRLRMDILHPMKFAFGFGHRTCPGRFLADALLFSHFSHVLAVFDVALPGPQAERIADAAMKIQSNGAACRVEHVNVSLKPRSEAASALIEICHSENATKAAHEPVN